MFQNFTVKDLTDQLVPITEHWKRKGIHFDAIYTGYLGSDEEIEIVKKIFADFGGDDTLIFVDPVMADHGKLYPAFDEALRQAQRQSLRSGRYHRAKPHRGLLHDRHRVSRGL